jgi:hypothetical protein
MKSYYIATVWKFEVMSDKYSVYTKEWCDSPLFTIETAPFFCVYLYNLHKMYTQVTSSSQSNITWSNNNGGPFRLKMYEVRQ